jgi:hypothetical protein
MLLVVGAELTTLNVDPRQVGFQYRQRERVEC